MDLKQKIKPQLVKDVEKIIESITSTLPPRRSGYTHSIFAVFRCLILLFQLSAQNVAQWMNDACRDNGISFQKSEKDKFSNGKSRRFFPDQSALSRYLKKLAEQGCIEDFWNAVNFAHLIVLKKIGIVGSAVKLIADYTTEKCEKNEEDPYCFGTKKGKICHKTLTFSVISKGVHQVVANFMIFKRQDKLPLFEKIMSLLQSNGFTVKYALLDREYYTKKILSAFKKWKVTVIMPGRKCALTAKKILAYLTKKGTRYCKAHMKLAYKKGVGYPLLRFDMLLFAKRKYRLTQIKRDLASGKLTLDEAAKRIFPLLVLRGTSGGITALRGNETYIRALYRSRWMIEIAFREMNKLGMTTRMQNRSVRVGRMGAKSLLYNIWQVQRHLIYKEGGAPLTLNEFLGKTYIHRYPQYISQAI